MDLLLREEQIIERGRKINSRGFGAVRVSKNLVRFRRMLQMFVEENEAKDNWIPLQPECCVFFLF
jgi:hypothetical protein